MWRSIIHARYLVAACGTPYSSFWGDAVAIRTSLINLREFDTSRGDDQEANILIFRELAFLSLTALDFGTSNTIIECHVYSLLGQYKFKG